MELGTPPGGGGSCPWPFRHCRRDIAALTMLKSMQRKAEVCACPRLQVLVSEPQSRWYGKPDHDGYVGSSIVWEGGALRLCSAGGPAARDRGRPGEEGGGRRHEDAHGRKRAAPRGPHADGRGGVRGLRREVPQSRGDDHGPVRVGDLPVPSGQARRGRLAAPEGPGRPEVQAGRRGPGRAGPLLPLQRRPRQGPGRAG